MWPSSFWSHGISLLAAQTEKLFRANRSSHAQDGALVVSEMPEIVHLETIRLDARPIMAIPGWHLNQFFVRLFRLHFYSEKSKHAQLL
jgi:hypothetical protein